MTPYDAGMAGIVVAGMVWGAIRGITWQIASIASLVLGYTVSHPLSGQIVGYFPGEPAVARALAMLAVYVGVSAGVFLAAWLVRATLKRLKFEAFDRHLGMLLGGAEGALVGLVVTLFVVSLAPATRDPIFKSPTGRVVGQLMAVLGPVLPEESRKVLSPFWEAAPAGTSPAPDLEPLPALSVHTPTASQPVSDRAKGDAVSPASFGELIGREAARVEKAIAEEATKNVRAAAGEATVTLKRAAGRARNSLENATGGVGDGRAIERR